MATDLDQTLRMSRKPLDAARAAIAPLYRRPEADTLRPLARAARLSSAERQRVLAQASSLLAALRAPGRAGWVDRFLREYSLSSEEGAALLGLAEAYLRVPDPATANALIRDKLSRGDWKWPPRRCRLRDGQRRHPRPDHRPVDDRRGGGRTSRAAGAWASRRSGPGSPPPCNGWARPSCSAATSTRR